MTTLTLYRRCCVFLLLAACGLAMLALLLHPMNPGDFLAMAAGAPLDTLVGAYGREVAVLFWIGLAMAGAAIAGLLFPPQALRQKSEPVPAAANGGGYATLDGEDAARLWSCR